jgi:2-polyprenyl-6-methoxyphenol hydroxylase-like FAD-dependent oxidoreductase
VISPRLQVAAHLPRFMEESVKTYAPAQWYTGARAVGPLATFDSAEVWVEHLYKNGVVLTGDVAATSDPTRGQGLSLTVRDVRILRDQLLAHEDWEGAGHAYAEEHDRYYTQNRHPVS